MKNYANTTPSVAPWDTPGLPAPTEEWRPVVGYEGFYEVSSLGQVRSLSRVDRSVVGWQRAYPARLLKLCPIEDARGGGSTRLRVTLCKNGTKRGFMVHKLVAATFLGEVPVGQETLHRNGDATDNRIIGDELRMQAVSDRYYRELIGEAA